MTRGLPLLLTALLFSADTAAIGIPDPIRHDGGWLEPEHRRGGGGGVDDPPGSPAGPQSHGRDGGQSVTEPGQAPKLTLYGYDNAANRTGKTVSENGVVSTATTYTFNPANQLVAWTERNGEGTTLRSATLTFDTRGNRSAQTITQPGAPAKTTSYSWDYQNRLVGVTDPQGGQHAYAYDYRTRRIARSEPGGATAVSWSGGLSLAEYPVTGLQGTVGDPEDPTVEYRRGPDMGGGIGGLLHSLRDGAPKYNLGNGRGDVVAQSDATGALTWTASYEAFGKRPVETGSNADRQRANTKEEDPTGLLWEHFRYRDLETGVWLSRDPAGFVDGPNLYAYVRQNPWTFWDPAGLSAYGDLINASGDRIADGRPLSGWAIGAVAMAWNAVSFGHAERMDQISDDWSNGDLSTGEMLVANGKSTLTASKDAALTFGAGGTLGKAASLYDKAETGAAVASDLAEGDFKGAALNMAGELGPGKKKGGGGSELGIKSAKETAGENAAKSSTRVDPNSIEPSHPTKLSSPFSNPAHGTVGDLAEALKKDPGLADKIPPVAVARMKGKTYTHDNRRHRAFKEAGVPISTVPATRKQIKAIKRREPWKK